MLLLNWPVAPSKSNPSLVQTFEKRRTIFLFPIQTASRLRVSSDQDIGWPGVETHLSLSPRGPSPVSYPIHSACPRLVFFPALGLHLLSLFCFLSASGRRKVSSTTPLPLSPPCRLSHHALSVEPPVLSLQSSFFFSSYPVCLAHANDFLVFHASLSFALLSVRNQK